MSVKKIICIVIMLISGIIGASFLIKSNDNDVLLKNNGEKKDPDTITESTKSVNDAINQMNELLNYSNVTDKTLFKEGFRKGVNIGDMLESSDENNISEYFKLIKKQGFDFVKIPIRWTEHINESIFNKESTYTIMNDIYSGKDADYLQFSFDVLDTAFLSKVDSIIDCAMQNGLGVIINVDEFNELFETEAWTLGQQVLRYNPYEQILFVVWANLAYHYKNLPDSVVFEIINSPHGEVKTREWSYIQNWAVQIIRQYDLKRKIIIQAGNYGSYDELTDLLIMKDDKNLIVSFNFAYQDTKWNGDEIERLRIEKVFKEVKSFSETTELPIILGGLGTSEQTDYSSRVLWTRYVRETAENYGFAWCYSDFCSSNGIYDTNADEFKDELTNALVSGNKDEYNIKKGGIKMTAANSAIFMDSTQIKYTAEFNFKYERRMQLYGGESTNFLLYDTNSNTQILNIKDAADGEFVMIPIGDKIYDAGSSFTKNTIEITLKIPDNSVTDLRISLVNISVSSEFSIEKKEVILFDADGSDKNNLSDLTGYDSKLTVRLTLHDYYDTFKGTLKGELYLKLFPETVPERKNSYDRVGSLEFIEMIIY